LDEAQAALDREIEAHRAFVRDHEAALERARDAIASARATLQQSRQEPFDE
jgi:hypothetical protein